MHFEVCVTHAEVRVAHSAVCAMQFGVCETHAEVYATQLAVCMTQFPFAVM
jgi:hypothetical protein